MSEIWYQQWADKKEEEKKAVDPKGKGDKSIRHPLINNS